MKGPAFLEHIKMTDKKQHVFYYLQRGIYAVI